MFPIFQFFEYLGGVTTLAGKTIVGFFRYRLDFSSFVYQIAAIGNRSFSLVALIAIFTGMVMALQLGVGLGRFGLKLYIGQVIGLAIVRELGPVLTCLMLAARVGSGPPVTMTSTLRPTSSAASAGRRSNFPSA